MTKKTVAIVGAGPAGLAAAEVLIESGCDVHLFDAMPSPARKFLWAGKSGLNLTHAEPFDQFKTRFDTANDQLLSALEAFTPNDIRRWADELGAQTFVGSSGRVFPKKMKASPLLRNWLKRLEQGGAKLHLRKKWSGIGHDGLVFKTNVGEETFAPDATIFALGGASYKRLGSDASWVPILKDHNVEIVPFRPANCGFEVDWSDHFVEKFSGQPIKSVAVIAKHKQTKGEFVISKYGIEGSLVYAHAAQLRDQLDAGMRTELAIDLLPGKSEAKIVEALERQNPKQSYANRIRKALRLTGAKAGLLREVEPEVSRFSHSKLAKTIKNLVLPVARTRPTDEAISVTGGISWDELDQNYMLKRLPGVFVSGEMIDWEAPTGGYLLTACFATGRHAARGVLEYLDL